MKRPNPAPYSPTTRQSTLLLDWRADYMLRSPVTLAPVNNEVTTFTRAASIATGVDSLGTVYSVMSHQPRTKRWYNSSLAQWESLLLIETEASANGYSNPEAMSSWTGTNVSIGTNDALNPRNDTNGDRILETVTSGAHTVGTTLAAMTNSTVQSFSIYARPWGRDWLVITTVDKANATARSWVNVTTGALGTVAGAHTITTEPHWDGWYRVTLRWNCGTGGTTPTLTWGIGSANDTYSYAGDTAKGLILWGAQHEVDKPVPSSYMGDIESRARATEYVTWTFPELCRTPLSIYVDWIELGVQALNGTLFSLGSTSDNAPRIACYASGNTIRAAYYDGGTTRSSGPPSGTLLYGQRCELLVTWTGYPTGIIQMSWLPEGAGSVTVASAAAEILIPSDYAWQSGSIRMGTYGPNVEGNFALRQFKIAEGVQSFATMQTIF